MPGMFQAFLFLMDEWGLGLFQKEKQLAAVVEGAFDFYEKCYS